MSPVKTKKHASFFAIKVDKKLRMSDLREKFVLGVRHMRVIGVIPARWGSTRFPGKPLAMIGNKPLLQWVLEGVRSSKKIQEFWLATDHKEIAALGEKLGVKVVMTDSDLATGSDRVWAAIKSENVDVAVNVQGDEPLMTGEILDHLVTPFADDQGLEMATLAKKASEEDLQSQQTAKIVLNQRSEAIYFSRFPIPFSRDKNTQGVNMGLKHIGVYAYRKSFLQKFCACPVNPLEVAEGLEQLRALYLGARIKVMTVDHDSWGVDTPEDVNKILTKLREKGRQ